MVVDIHSGIPIPSFADGSYVFDLSTSHFYAVTRSTIDTSNVYWSQQEDPSDWLGIGSLGELLNRASAIGDWGYDETQHEIQYLSAFTAGTVLQELGEWTSITPIGGYPLAENVVGLADFIDTDLHNFDSPGESYLSPGNGITFTAGTPANPKLSINAVPEYAADWIGDNYIAVGGALSLAVVDADVTNNIDRSLTITNTLTPYCQDPGNGNTRLFLAADLDLTGPSTLAWTPPSAAPFSTYYAPLYIRLKDTVLVGGPTITITSDDSAGTLTISGPPAGSGEANPQRITTAEAGSFVNATLTDGDTLRSWSQNLFRQSVYGSIRSGGASATTTVKGTVEYATNTEAVASSPVTTRVITPANLAHWGSARITDGALSTGNASSESTSIAPSRQTVAEMGASIISQAPAVTDSDLATNNTMSESTSAAPSRQAVAEMGAAIISQIGSGGGGGGGTPAARILLGSRTINDDDTPYTIVFTEGVPRGNLLQIEYGANPMIYAEITSDVILNLTQSAATPTNLNNGINLKVARVGENSLSQFGHGGISIWKATSSSTNLTMIWVAASHDLTSNAVMTVYAQSFSGSDGADGMDSTVPGPAGATGADSTVPGPVGPIGLTGTVVTANPSGAATGADLTKIQIGSTIHDVAGGGGGGGTIVAANPSGSDGSDLTRIAIGGTNWVIPAGADGAPGPIGPTGADSTVPGPRGDVGPAGTGTVVTASASSVSGATEAGSFNIAGTDWNLPSGGAGGRDTFVVNTPSERPTCTSSIAGYQYYVLQSDSEYVCVNISHTATVSTGSFVVVATRSDLGVETNLPNPSSLTVGIFAYLNTDNVSSGGQEFYEVEQVSANHRSWVQTNATAALADSRSNNSYSITWLGSESTPADALEFTHSISANRDYFYLDVEDDLFYRLNTTTFVGAGSVVDHYQWLLVGANLGDLAYQDKIKQTQFEDNAILTDALNAGAVTYPKLTTALQQKLNNAVVGFQQEATTLLVRQTSLDTGMATDTVFPLAMLDSNSKLAVAVIPDGYNEAIDEVTATNSGLSFLKVGSTNTTQVIAPSAVRTAAGLSTAAAIRTAAGLGTAAVLNTGVASGNVPVLDSNGKLATSTYDAGTGGISQSDADSRYVELGGDTMTSTLNVVPDSNAVALFLNATALTTQTPFVFNINATGNQQAMWLRRGTTGQAWLTVDGNIGGGNGNPGFALGIGGTAGRDVLLYRGGDDLLETPDSFTVGGDLTVTGGYGLVAADIPTIPSTKVSGLGSLATLSSVSASNVSGLGDLAILDSVSTSNVSGLGNLAVLDAVGSGQITDASVSLVDLNSGVTATLVANSEAFDGAVPINNGLRFDRVDDANPADVDRQPVARGCGRW